MRYPRRYLQSNLIPLADLAADHLSEYATEPSLEPTHPPIHQLTNSVVRLLACLLELIRRPLRLTRSRCAAFALWPHLVADDTAW